MLDSLQKLLAVTGPPIAAIVAIGVLAEVTNLWRVERTYRFSYIEGWHAVGLVDRWILIGLGVKYLFFTLLILLPLVGLFSLLRWLVRGRPSSPPSSTESQGTWTARWIQTSTPTSGTAESNLTTSWTQTTTGSDNKTPKSLVERWVLLVVAATALMFIWLPLHALISPNKDEVLNYLPHVELSVTADSSSPTGSIEENEPTFTSIAKPVDEVVEPAIIEGVLLSHDANYWYLLSQEGLHEGNLVAVPLDKASDIRITSPQPSNLEDVSSPE